MDPHFDLRRESLAKVGKSTCYIAVKLPDGNVATGTAFFVSESKLLTAGHMRYGADNEIVAQYPGAHIANLNAKELFEDDPPVSTFKCRVLDYRRPAADIMLLDCSASGYRASCWVDLMPSSLCPDTPVDLVGYPGLYEHQYLMDTQGRTARTAEALDEISDLLPRCHLIISHGPVIGMDLSGNHASYRLSTIGGMSGSAVVRDEKAVGNHF